MRWEIVRTPCPNRLWAQPEPPFCRQRQQSSTRCHGGEEGGEVEAPAKKRGRFSAYETVDPIAVPTSLPFKRSTVKDTSKRRPWKPLKKIIEGESYERLPIDVPTYSGIEAPPSLLPAKKYCDLTGLEAKYTDPKTRLRYFSGQEYLQIRYLSEHSVEEFLKFRGANQKLK